MEPLWTITLFNELTLRRADSDGADTKGEVRRFRSQKAASLLAYLAFHRGRAVSREFLCDILWPDEPNGEITRNRFRVALASLRRQLEPPGVPPGAVIESVGNHQVRLRAETVHTDVAAFEAAVRGGDTARALALYRGGPLLPGFYEEWILGEQARLVQSLESLGVGPPSTEQKAEAVPNTLIGQAVTETVPDARKSVSVPLYITRFFGRDAERAQLDALLCDVQTRLITLTGPGGIGKTRLAAEAVRGDPTLRAFVPLADIWNAGQLGDALRQALQLPPAPNGDALHHVVEYLNRESKTRIVLDNVEQIAQGTALFVGELLARAPRLSLLLTSRRRLDFPGEREIIVAPLSVPTGDVLEQVASAPSVLLFLDRAQAVRPDYQITARNAADVHSLCHLLDGVPLALELAAARAGTMTPEQIRIRLAERISSNASLETGFKGREKNKREERHRSMNAVVEWSYALLPPDLRRFFLALSVFRGNWDVAAAQAVTGEEHALDYLSRLRGHSLLTPDGGRLRLLETIRSWADEHLEGGTHRAALLDRHARYYVQTGEAAVARTGGENETDALQAIEADEPNIRAAFERVVGDESNKTGAAAPAAAAETALRAALILYALGRVRGNLSETLETMHRALAVADAVPEGNPAVDKSIHARTLWATGQLTQIARGMVPARPLLDAALRLAQQSGNNKLVARVLRSLADNAVFAEDYDAALPLFEQALTLQRNENDERAVAQTLNSMALLALRKNNDVAEGIRLVKESAHYFRRIGDTRALSYNVFNLGELALEQGEPENAEAYFRESLAFAEELRDEWHRLESLFALARTAGKREQWGTRRALMAEVLPLALRTGDIPTLVDALREQADVVKGDRNGKRTAVALLSAAHAIARQANDTDASETAASADAAVFVDLPERSFRAAWNRGAGLTPQNAVALACQ